MTVKELRQWLAVYPDDHIAIILTENGPRHISPVGESNDRKCALGLFHKDIVARYFKERETP